MKKRLSFYLTIQRTNLVLGGDPRIALIFRVVARLVLLFLGGLNPVYVVAVSKTNGEEKN